MGGVEGGHVKEEGAAVDVRESGADQERGQLLSRIEARNRVRQVSVPGRRTGQAAAQGPDPGSDVGMKKRAEQAAARLARLQVDEYASRFEHPVKFP